MSIKNKAMTVILKAFGTLYGNKVEVVNDPRFEGVKPSNIVRLENGERELMKNCVFVPKAVKGDIKMVWVRL